MRLGLPVPLAEMHPPGYPGGIIMSWQRKAGSGGRLHNSNIFE